MTPPFGSVPAIAARHPTVRAHNLALVLRTVARSPAPPSRASIASTTGLTRATVSALVEDLITGRLLVELEPPPRAGAGRPAAGLALSPTGPAGLGCEINVDYLAACVVDLGGTVRHRFVEQTGERATTAAETIAALARLAARARAAGEADGLVLTGIGVAAPGLISAGSVLTSPNLGWADVPLSDLLGSVPELSDLTVEVDNEANLAAMGELRVGDGDETFLYVSGDIGIGAGLVIDGALSRGAHGWSGEIGHVTVYPDGRPCTCGADGCLEQYAGQGALEARDPGVATALGIALSSAINLLDLPLIVLGGVYAARFDELRDEIERQLRRRVLTGRLTPVTVRAARLGRDAAMRGAADAALREVRRDPATWLRRAVDGRG